MWMHTRRKEKDTGRRKRTKKRQERTEGRSGGCCSPRKALTKQKWKFDDEKARKCGKSQKNVGRRRSAKKRRVHSSGFQHNLSVTGISLLMGVQRKDRGTSQKPEEQKDARKAHGC